jgi:hypothetical protein
MMIKENVRQVNSTDLETKKHNVLETGSVSVLR